MLKRALVLVGRALLRRCPNCGARGIFTRWFWMKPECPDCGLDFERSESGYIVGAYMLNIVAAEFLLVVGIVIVILMTWPSVPWKGVQIGGVALMIVAPLLTYPISKTCFLAMDLWVRPEKREKISRHSRG